MEGKKGRRGGRDGEVEEVGRGEGRKRGG
jgi:hypothetical protein